MRIFIEGKSRALPFCLVVSIYFSFSSFSHTAGYDADNANASAYAGGWGTNSPQWSLDGTTFVQGNNSGFGGWLLTADVNAAVRIESVASLAAGSAIDTGGKSFRLSGGYYSPDGGTTWNQAYSHATRYLDPSGLSEGQTLSFQIAVNYRNGAKGVDLFDTNGQKIFNFNVGGDDYGVNNTQAGSGSVGNAYSSDSVFSFLFAQTTSNGGTWKITRSGGVATVSEGTYAGIIRRVDWYAGGTDNNNPDALFFNNLVIGPARTINLSVDLKAKIGKASFNPNNHGLVVKGSFDWGGAGFPLTDTDGDGIYTGSIVYPGVAGTSVEYRMYATGIGALQWEDRWQVWNATGGTNGGSHNRSLVLGPDGSAQSVEFYFGDDDGIGPVVARTGLETVNLQVGDSYVDQGATATDFVEGNCAVTASVSPTAVLANISQTPGRYVVTYESWDAAGNKGNVVTRTVVVSSAVNDGYDDFISGKTTNSQTLAEYAFGATDVGVLASDNRPQVSVSGANLVLAYQVRVTNPALVVTPQLSTSLPSFAADNSIAIRTNSRTTNNGVVLEQRTASVPIDSAGRKFLRLQVQRGP